MHKCPYCAESIADNSIICRFCWEDLWKIVKEKSKDAANKKMKSCPFCDEEISENAIKCEYCWEELWEKMSEKVEVKNNEKREINEKLDINKSENQIIIRIQDHLEFLWYECNLTIWNDVDILSCTNPSKSNMSINYNKKSNYAFFRSRYSLNEEYKVKQDEKYFEIYNTINSKASFTRWYSTVENNKIIINIEWTFQWYEKKFFWIFIDYYEMEIKQFVSQFNEYLD